MKFLKAYSYEQEDEGIFVGVSEVTHSVSKVYIGTITNYKIMGSERLNCEWAIRAHNGKWLTSTPYTVNLENLDLKYVDGRDEFKDCTDYEEVYQTAFFGRSVKNRHDETNNKSF